VQDVLRLLKKVNNNEGNMLLTSVNKKMMNLTVGCRMNNVVARHMTGCYFYT
jgi:hypothetical protein